MERCEYNFTRSSLCDIGMVWIEKDKRPRIIRIFLSEKNNDIYKRIKRFFPAAKKTQNKKINFILGNIRSYLEGEIINFNFSGLQKIPYSRFQRAVLLATRRIPYGKVIAYKGLAELVGAKSARAVANALAKNPFPIVIPCHRVVTFDRKIGGFQPGRNLKKVLLKLEGITFDKKGRIPEGFFLKI